MVVVEWWLFVEFWLNFKNLKDMVIDICRGWLKIKECMKVGIKFFLKVIINENENYNRNLREFKDNRK